jgi:hypothetical protein
MVEILNLDKLIPEPITAILGGKEIKVYPGKLKSLIKTLRAFKNFKDAEGLDGQLAVMDSLMDALKSFVPALNDDDMDISIDQVNSLVELAFKVSQPADDTEIKKAELDPKKVLTP